MNQSLTADFRMCSVKLIPPFNDVLYSDKMVWSEPTHFDVFLPLLTLGAAGVAPLPLNTGNERTHIYGIEAESM